MDIFESAGLTPKQAAKAGEVADNLYESGLKSYYSEAEIKTAVLNMVAVHQPPNSVSEMIQSLTKTAKQS